MIHLLLNPVAGRGRALAQFDSVQAALRAAGQQTQVWRSAYPGHARVLAGQIPHSSTLLVIGGDGTVHEVLDACLSRELRLGIIPSGSGDDFAFALGIPRDQPAAAALLAVGGRERRVDVGRVNDTLFINAFGSGFDAEVARRVLAAPSRYKGLWRYLFGIFTSLKDLQLSELRLAMEHPDGSRSEHRGFSLFVSVQNGPRGGGNFLIAPGARVDDGVLDVVVAAHAEGELIAPEAAYRVTLLPAALRVWVPAR